MVSAGDMEEKLKQRFAELMDQDFNLCPEVPGIYPVDNTKVIIDYMLYPKQHLVNRGFDPVWFGVEVKYIPFDQEKRGIGTKMRKLVWQSITYAQSTFDIDSMSTRPFFVGMYIGDKVETTSEDWQDAHNKKVQWRFLMWFAQIANVGVIEQFNNVDWGIAFGGGYYFHRRKGKGNVKNIGTVRYVGSN